MPYLVLREGNDVGELLAPADLVEQGLVTDVLTRVAVQPALLRRRVHLRPDMVYARDGPARGSGAGNKSSVYKTRTFTNWTHPRVEPHSIKQL